jgi:hypothetical protein
LKIIWSLILLAGCAQVTGLNMRKHQFGRQPTKIVWIQVAGLDHEQLAMLRFNATNAEEKTVLESSTCYGQAWSFNLYNLRPTAQGAMLAQVTGKKDITGSCEDWQLKPLWGYLADNGYKNGILELDARPEESLLTSKRCEGKGTTYLDESILWVMQANNPMGAESYLPMVSQEFKPGRIYWDKTCNAQGCGTALRTSLGSVYRQFAKNSARHLLLVRDFSFKHALERQSLSAAREVLREIDKTVENFYQLAEARDDVLVLVTGAGSVDIDFPAEGKDWQNFDLKGVGAMPRRGELTVPVFAYGARAENFCGMYEESQIFERMTTSPKKQGLELKIINPFN